MYLDLYYYESGSSLYAYVSVTGIPENESNAYEVKFTIPGKPPIYSQLQQNQASCNSSLILNPSSSSPKTTIAVSAQLIKKSTGASAASDSKSITIIGNSNASSQPTDPNVTVTINKPVPALNNYLLTANSIAYLESNPGKKLYFYAFYVPNDNERYNQNMKDQFLGKVTIEKTSMFAAEGNMSVSLPGTGYNVENLRIMVTKVDYPYSYFTYPMNVPGPIGSGGDYLIYRCVYDTMMYNTSLSGLNSTSGRFSSWQNSSYMNITIGSMDEMMNTQIYYCKSFGYL
nr:hypothetical protein [Pedobacter panaciterrae]